MPKLTFFVFSLPDCQLLHSLELPGSLEQDEMDQRYLLKDNTMMFLFHDQEFFNNVFLASTSLKCWLVLTFIPTFRWRRVSGSEVWEAGGGRLYQVH